MSYKLANYLLPVSGAVAIALSANVHATLVVPALEKHKIGHQFQVTASFKSAKTSVERTSYSGNFNWDYGREDDHVMAFGNINYGDVDGKTYLDKNLIHVRYIRYRVLGKVSLETFVQREQNDLASLANRSLVGAGLSRLFGEEDDKFTYHLMGGIMLESEKHITDTSLNRENTRFTVSNQLSWDVFTGSRFTLTNYIQPKVSDIENYRFIIDGTLSVPISEQLSIALSANFRRYTDAYEGIPTNTNAISTSITYKF
jgi:hypothetical protein